MADDLCSHGVAYSVSVDENVVWKLAIVVITEGLESAFEVSLEHA